MKMLRLLIVTCFFCFLSELPAEEMTPESLKGKRILFLGDSITHAGGYIVNLEAQLRAQGLEPAAELINLGLASETCCGLSEPDHPFPRPNVQERIDRALKRLEPDILVACYGMNDGIYYPFSEERFAKYQEGIRTIVQKGKTAGAKVVILTPPPFDPKPVQEKLRPAGADEYAYYAPYAKYDEVLKKYAQWIMNDLDEADLVIDLHTPLSQYLQEQRKKDPDFTLAPDGVHCNANGHQMIADAILSGWGIKSREPIPEEISQLAKQKQRLIHDSWLTAVGHKRPNVKEGLPLDEMREKVEPIEQTLEKEFDVLRTPLVKTRPSYSGQVHEVHYPATLTGDELKLYVDYYLWIPEGLETIRGVIVHQHGCGVGASKGGRTAADDLHWQALAEKWDCALLGSSYEPRSGVDCRDWCDPRNGSGERFVEALRNFAKATHHEELKEAPWCLWGHSGGGFWSSLMQAKHPERIVAIWFRSGTAYPYWEKKEIEAPELSAAVYEIPMMANPGIKEKSHERFQTAWKGLKAMQAAYKSQGASFFEFSPDPESSHDCGASRYLAIPFFDFWLEHRLPEKVGGNLRPVAPALKAWEKKLEPKALAYRQGIGVSDSTPPPAPTNPKATKNEDQSITLTWNAEADLESGIKGFVIRRNNEIVAQLPEKERQSFSRPVFQGQSYHDTPVEPLPLMKWIDRDVPQGSTPVYSIQTLNTVDLISPAAYTAKN